MTAIVTKPLQTELIQAEQAANEPQTLNQIITEVQATGEPLLVTIEGKPQIVALSVEAYHAMQDRIEVCENVATLYKADAEGDCSGDKPAREFFGELRYWKDAAAVQKALLQSEQALPAREAFEELGRQHGLLR